MNEVNGLPVASRCWKERCRKSHTLLPLECNDDSRNRWARLRYKCCMRRLLNQL